MKKRESNKLSDKIRLLGLKSEVQLNQLIQNGLNQKRIIDVVKLGLKEHTRSIKDIHRFQDKLTKQLNIPTKNDIANLAKLILQLEEKIDMIEDRTSHLDNRNSLDTTISKKQKKKDLYKKLSVVDINHVDIESELHKIRNKSQFKNAFHSNHNVNRRKEGEV